MRQETGAQGEAEDFPAYPSHYRPRTRAGRIALVAFLTLLALTQPPFVGLANRIEPWLFGLPFLYTYLLLLYTGSIVVLIWSFRRGL